MIQNQQRPQRKIVADLAHYPKSSCSVLIRVASPKSEPSPNAPNSVSGRGQSHDSDKCHKIRTKGLRSFSIFYSFSVFEDFYYLENKFRELQVIHEIRKFHISKFVEWIFEFLLNTILFIVQSRGLISMCVCVVSCIRCRHWFMSPESK